MIYIIGAGWYGSHIALELLKTQKSNEIRLVDKTNAFFNGSSARNQNRLHLGYHYPRSTETIDECRQGFAAFKATYPALSTPIPNNLYLIAQDSQTSPVEFSNRFNNTGELLCIEGRTPFQRVRNMKPTMFPVAEEYIDNAAAAAYFSKQLSPYFLQLPPSAFESIETLRHMLGIQDTDWIINCTYNQLEPIEMDHYELYCSLVYKIPGPPFGLTIMDGPYFSIYPYDLANHLYTVTSVVHGVVWKGITIDREKAEWSTKKEKEVKTAVEAQVTATLPEFPTVATYQHCFLSWKTKPLTQTQTQDDDRSLRFQHKCNTISIYGGKITGIFEASKRVLEIVGALHTP